MKKKRYLRPVWGVLLLGVLIALVARLFIVKTISCQTPFGSCPAEYHQALGKFSGKVLSRVSTRQVREVLTQFSQVKEVRIGKQYPNHLIVTVVSRQPLGILGGQIIDSDGVVLGEASGSSLPKLSGELVDTRASDQQLTALKQLNTAAGYFTGPVMGKIEESKLIVYTSGMEVWLSLENSDSGGNSWSDSLQLILTRSKIDGKAPRKIDLRFRDPIIVY